MNQLNYNIILVLFLLQFISVVQTGQNGNGGSCTPQFPCSSCSSSPTNCSQCIKGIGRSQESPCQCLPGYYQIGENNKDCEMCDNTKCGTCEISSNQCIKSCHISCKTCDIEGKCTSCSDSYFVSNGICNQYDKEVCNKCKDVQVVNSDCQCIINNFYDDQTSQCQNCQYPCKQCCQPTLCITCINIPNRNKEPECNCLQGYFNDTSKDNICIKCHYKCKYCSSYDQCIGNICSNSIYRDFSKNCDCAEGFYEDNHTCQQCQYPCKTCIQYNKCTECLYNGTNRGNNTNCECDIGFYHNSNTNECEKCDIQCQTCKIKKDFCIQCNEILNDKTVEIQNFRINKEKYFCGCKNGFYSDGINLKCLQCQYPCKKCINLDECIELECVNLMFRDKDCSCKQGYFDNGEFCEKCHSKCKKCKQVYDYCIN